MRFLTARLGYDPLVVAEGEAPKTVDLTVEDVKRKRQVPALVYLPKGEGAAPVALFSHGLGGNRRGSKFLGEHWARRGYVAVFVQHPGSDDSVWRGLPPSRVMGTMREAANGENFLLRVADIPAVLDALTEWNKKAGHPLAGRLDLSRIGMSGHSFGAVTTQAVSGQSFPAGVSLTDKRIKAAVVMSPSGPRGGSAARAFGGVRLPWLLMTGTKDNSPIGNETPESRLVVYPALPPGDKYEVVLDGAEHSVFTDRRLPKGRPVGLPGGRPAPNPNHQRAILALTTAFWDTYLRPDPSAKSWLDGPGPRTILEKADRWQKK